METLMTIYENFMVWYSGLWYDMVGETGVEILRGCSLTILLAMVVIAVIGEIDKDDYEDIIKIK